MVPAQEIKYEAAGFFIKDKCQLVRLRIANPELSVCPFSYAGLLGHWEVNQHILMLLDCCLGLFFFTKKQ
jgi:hypothetical protein